jgi:hypothetical protein
MKKIYVFLIAILVGLLCTANQCNKDDCHKSITFVNNSLKEVYIHAGWYHDTLNFSSFFPNPYDQPNLYRVKSGESNNNGFGVRKKDCLENKVAQGNAFMYVFDSEVLSTISWGTVEENYMVLKTYHPTLEEMENNDWTIYFTGE